MKQAIKNGAGNGGVFIENISPFFECFIAGQNDASSFIAGADDLKKQIGPVLVNRKISYFIHAQNVSFSVIFQCSHEISGYLCRMKVVDDIGSSLIKDGIPIGAGMKPQGSQQMRFTHTGQTQKCYIFLILCEFQGKKIPDEIRNLHHENGLTRWEVWHAGALWAPLEMQLAGEHNALNATAAAALAFGQGICKESICAALATFKSVKRRLEVRAEIGGITIIEDFAHHPTAIRETLRALRSVYPQSRLWAVLEPRSNTLRRKVLEGDLVASLRLADEVILAGVYQQQRIPELERLHPEDVVRALNAAGTPAELCVDAEAIVNSLAPRLKPGDVVAILSNGGFDGIYEKLPLRLKQLHP